MVGRLLSVLTSVALGACSVVGVRDGTEEPKYDVVARVGSVEIRRYAARVAAETTVPGDEIAARGEGFRRLAGYIFGANARNTSIAMTAPVAQAATATRSETIAMTAPVSQDRTAAGEWTIRFFMPGQYSLATLPTPNDPSVRLVPVPPETMAVLRFSGSIGAEAVADRQRALLHILSGGAWVVSDTPLGWFYDPPWTIPALRRNEVAVAVRAAP